MQKGSIKNNEINYMFKGGYKKENVDIRTYSIIKESEFGIHNI